MPRVTLIHAHKRLKSLDEVALRTLCLTEFPQVYERFSEGMRRDKEIELLLDHLRRNPKDLPRLERLLPATGLPLPDRDTLPEPGGCRPARCFRWPAMRTSPAGRTT